jgi:hypothetical protein
MSKQQDQIEREQQVEILDFNFFNNRLFVMFSGSFFLMVGGEASHNGQGC